MCPVNVVPELMWTVGAYSMDIKDDEIVLTASRMDLCSIMMLRTENS